MTILVAGAGSVIMSGAVDVAVVVPSGSEGFVAKLFSIAETEDPECFKAEATI